MKLSERSEVVAGRVAELGTATTELKDLLLGAILQWRSEEARCL